jgi:Skp family chaperone for outer membrane proteins
MLRTLQKESVSHVSKVWVAAGHGLPRPFFVFKSRSGQTKVAIVSMQRAVLGCAEIKKASAEMEAKYKPRQQEMEKLQRELAGIQQQLQTNAGKLTPAAEADLNAQGSANSASCSA